MTDGQPYLRLEQVHHDVTTRVLVISNGSGAFSLMAGIVTTPERSLELLSFTSRSYFEFGMSEPLLVRHGSGAHANESVIWVERDLDEAALALFRSENLMGIWLDNEGPGRWGAMIHTGNVKDEIEYFISNCGR